MIRYGLHLHHTSFQAYKQMLEKIPLPSFLLLNKMKEERVSLIKALKILWENGKISNDCILMVDEMYLEKASQYHGGGYVGVDDEINLYKGMAALMIVGLKELIPYIVQAIPEVKFSGEWLADKMSNSIDGLASAEFCVPITTIQMYMHFLHLLQCSNPIHINASRTQEILTRKRTCFIIWCIPRRTLETTY